MKTNRVLAIAIALLCSLLVVVPATASTVQAQTFPPPTPGLSLSKGAPTEVLAGDAVAFTLEASNVGPGPVYNLSFPRRPPARCHVRRADNAAAPSGPGEPRIETNEVESPAGSGNMVDQQTLIWENVSDLQANDSFSLSFPVDLNETPSLGVPTYPVGSTVSNTGEVYGSKNARVIPTFTSTGEPGSQPGIRRLRHRHDRPGDAAHCDQDHQVGAERRG